MAISRLGLALNMKEVAVSQYDNFDFNSMTVFNGVPIGSNSNGIYSLFDKDDDDGADINSILELVVTDFGLQTKKKPRRVYIGYEASGNMVFKIKADDGDYKVYHLKPVKTSQLQHRTAIAVTSKQKGVYWLTRVENKEGCDFSIDAVEMLMFVLGRSR